MNETILATLIEAVALQKEAIDDISSTLDLLTSETKTNQDEIVKTKDLLQKKIEDLIITTQKMIDKALSSIKIPDVEKVDYLRIETSIKAKISRLMEERDKDLSEFRSELKDYIIENLSKFKPKDGKNGKDADNQLIIEEIKSYILSNKELFKGEKGATGVGIEDITKNKDQIIITLTDGTIKKFSIPKTTVHSGGGGGVNFYSLEYLTLLLDSDDMLIIRDNQPFKVKMSVLSGYFGTSLPFNSYTDANGQGYTDSDGNYYTTA